MITKESFLQDVRLAAQQGLVSLEEITHVFVSANTVTPSSANADAQRSITVTDVLYFIGGIIVFLGIVTLLSEHWQKLSFFTRLLATLGSGTAAYYSGLLMTRAELHSRLAHAVFLISALALPMGIGILFDHYGWTMDRYGVQACVGGILAAFFLTSYAIFETNVFLVFTLVYGTWFFHALLLTLVGPAPALRHFKEYRFQMNGLVFGLLGYAFAQHKERQALSGALYGFGVLLFLQATFSLMGWKPNANHVWEALYPGIVLGILFLSVFLKSKSFLVFGSIYLVGYIGKITVDYFKDSYGWPLCLVVIGFSLMGIGYAAYQLNTVYFKTGRLE